MSLLASSATESTHLSQPLKWWGGKHYLAARIVDLMPCHLHYVEAFAGGLAVLLEKDPLDQSKYWGEPSYEQGTSEVVNDLHRELTNFWRVLQREETFAAFQRLIEATPFSEVEWEDAEVRQHPIKDPDVEAAVAFFIRCRQSRAGGFKDFATLSRNRTRRLQNEQVSAWRSCIEGLPAVSARLRRVVVLNQPALEVIRQQDGPGTVFYLDPPYLHDTRVSTGTYQHEMTEQDHRELLAVIKKCQGKVMLSGYPNPLYDGELAGWRRQDFEIDNKAAGGKKKRQMIEALWMNFDNGAGD
ncbi:MAG: DNA adenine methylase [Thermoguttaceae bacterium]